MFMSPPSGEHWTSWCSWQSYEEKPTTLQTEHCCRLRFTKDHEEKPEGDGTKFCGRMRPTSNSLAWMRNIMFGDETLHSSIRTWTHLWDMGQDQYLWTRTSNMDQDPYYGPGQLAVFDGAVSSELYQNIRLWTEAEQEVGPAVRQQPKHTSRSTKEHLEQKDDNVLERLSQSPDLSPVEMLWKDLKQQQRSSNISELRRFCRRNELINSYWKRLVEVLLLKEVKPVTESKGSHTFASHKYVRLDHFPQ